MENLRYYEARADQHCRQSMQNDAASCASSDSQALSFSMLVGMMAEVTRPSFDMSGAVRGARSLQ